MLLWLEHGISHSLLHFWFGSCSPQVCTSKESIVAQAIRLLYTRPDVVAAMSPATSRCPAIAL